MKNRLIPLSNAWPGAAAILVLWTISTFAGLPPVRGQYRVIDLGRLGGFRSEARGINAHGEIAGLSTSDNGYQAVRWRWGETNYIIEALGKGEAYGIADDGKVAGLSEGAGGALWGPNGAPTILGLDARVNAISGNGTPVGWIFYTATNSNPPFNTKFPKHAAYFVGASGSDLTQRPEWDCAVAGVDRTGSHMVGSVFTNVFALSGVLHAWLFPGRDLHTFTAFANSVALGVNTSGQVVGYANNNNSGPFNQPMFWSESTEMRLLNTPGSSPNGLALGVNDGGQAVGALGSSAVLWVNIGQPDETNVFLNNLPPLGHGWNLQAAYAINNRGEIVGYGLNPLGFVDGFILVPTNILNNKVVLRALEVNQVIQDWANDVPLVADKATLVRAHLQLFETKTEPILVENARLRAWNATSGATAEWPPDNGRIIVTTNDCASPVLRSNLNATLNFTVRDGWKNGQSVFSFVWADGVVVNREPAGAAGDLGSNGQVRVSFTPVPPLGVRLVRVALTNAAGTNLPSLAQLDEEKRRLLSIYPISSVANLTYGYLFWSAANGAPTNESRLLSQINAARLLSSDTNGVVTNRIWYGIVSSNVVSRGLGYVGGSAAEGNISRAEFDFQRHLAAHEIGHTLGRQHAIHSSYGVGPCGATSLTGHCQECARPGTPNFPMVTNAILGLMPTLGPLSNDNVIIWGYDTYLGRVISPYYHYDVMSYCYGFNPAVVADWPWNSQHTYTNMFNTILTRFSGEAAPLHGPPPGFLSFEYLLVRGEIQLSSNAASFLPFYPLENPLPPPATGDYTLRVLDSSLQSLLDIPFTPDVPPREFDYEPVGSFNISIPVLPDAVGVAVLYQGTVLNVLLASSNAPVVQALQPNGGENFGDTNIVVQWTASDADGDTLFFLVQFSPDGGDSWQTIGIDEMDTTATIPPGTLSATTNGLIRVIATDGFNVDGLQSSGFFTVSNRAPRVSIFQPRPGALFYGDQTIILAAAADDLEDGALDGANLLWSSTPDGNIAQGVVAPVETLNLSKGAHLITVTATDSGGLTNSASVQIFVLREAPPALSIALVDSNQALLSWPAATTNFVLESTLDLVPGNWAEVSNAPVVTNASQTVTVGVTNTGKFFRLRFQ